MGVVDFDPEKWSQAHSADLVPDVAKVAKLAEVGRADPSLTQLSQLSQGPSLPPQLLTGLRCLQSMATPRLLLPEGWPAAVADALKLANDGWAAKALALGWDPLDLFGAVTDRHGYSEADGLAVWLSGRAIRTMSETYASVSDGVGWAFFNRCNRLGDRLLWEIGR